MQINIEFRALMNDALLAWALSRDPEGTYDMKDIAGVDAPVMEMPSALLHFEDFMILEREIICSLRNHVVWARTSRVDDPMLFTVPTEFKIRDHESYKEQMDRRKAAGEPQDEWRTLMPLVAHTSWTQRINLRDLARLALYFQYLTGKAEWDVLGKRFAAVQFKIVETITKMIGAEYCYNLLNGMRLAKFLNEEIIPPASGLHQIGYFKSVTVNVNMALRAQIIRHREIQFIDDFWPMINTKRLPEVKLMNFVNMQLMARDDVWRAVLGKRSCWISQADLWDPLIKAFGWHPPLPCAGTNRCPYEVDARARLTKGKDPNPPCPVFCNLYHIDKEPHAAAMMKEAKKRGEFWTAEVAR